MRDGVGGLGQRLGRADGAAETWRRPCYQTSPSRQRDEGLTSSSWGLTGEGLGEKTADRVAALVSSECAYLPVRRGTRRR